MADPDISVVPEDVRAAGRYAYGLAQELAAALDSASSDVRSLLTGGWSGTSASEFGAGWDELRAGGVDVFDALTGMAAKLGVTAANYEDRDQRTRDAISDAGVEAKPNL